jgi:hypothetical protein
MHTIFQKKFQEKIFFNCNSNFNQVKERKKVEVKVEVEEKNRLGGKNTKVTGTFLNLNLSLNLNNARLQLFHHSSCERSERSTSSSAPDFPKRVPGRDPLAGHIDLETIVQVLFC